MTSTDGIDWDLEVPSASVTTNAVFLGVAASTNLLVAVGAKGSIIVSPSAEVPTIVTNAFGQVVTNIVDTMGILWYDAASPTTNDFQGITFAREQWLATGANGAILRSQDGTNWHQAQSGVSAHLSSVSSSPSGFFAVGRNGTLNHQRGWSSLDSSPGEYFQLAI